MDALYRRLPFNWVRYPLYLFLILAIITLFVPRNDTDGLTLSEAVKLRPNPWRDIPADQEVALKEVRFIAKKLRATFLPTSLPDEDDFELFSKLLRSLETRDDISWLTIDETEVAKTMASISSRYDFAPEPFRLTRRFDRLHNHWYHMERQHGKPDQWEVEQETTFLPPLLQKTELDSDGLTGTLSQEQKDEMEESYAEWKADRDHRLAYLKIHPPTPLTWVPLPDDNGDKRPAWEEVVKGGINGPGGIESAGERVDYGLLAKSQRWKPIYAELALEDIPWDWLGERFKTLTVEEFHQRDKKWERDMRSREERSRKQKEVQVRLRAEKEQAKGSKEELQQV